MNIEQVVADAKELCYRVAPAELSGSPLYIVPQTSLPPMLGANTVCYGYTSPSLDMHLHHTLADWKGDRGPVIVLGNLNIERDFPKRTYNKMLGTTLHELAHILERPSLFKPRPYNQQYIRAEAIRVAEAVSKDEEGDGSTPPWTTHEARFMRIAYHLCIRARRLGYDIEPAEVYSPDLNFEETERSKIFPGEAFGYWKVIVERPLRLRSQLTIPRIEALRFASGDEEIRETLYEEFGDALVDDFGSIKKQLTKRLAEWGSDEDDEDGGGGKSLLESKKKKLLKPETWQRDARLVELGTWLREHLGSDPFDDYNVFAEVATEKLAEHDKKPAAAELKLVLRGASNVDETAPPVIAKVSKPNRKGETKVDADPKHGRYRWGELPECLRPSSGRKDAYPAESVVEFEPDADLRDSEQIPLLEPGGIEAFIEREVLPYTPDACLQDKKGSVKIGYEISFTRHFYRPEPLRTLDKIRADIVQVEKEAEGLLDELLHEGAAV